jgi:hypothetical protein
LPRRGLFFRARSRKKHRPLFLSSILKTSFIKGGLKISWDERRLKTVPPWNILLRIKDKVRWFKGGERGVHRDGLAGIDMTGGIEGREEEARDTAG